MYCNYSSTHLGVSTVLLRGGLVCIGGKESFSLAEKECFLLPGDLLIVFQQQNQGSYPLKCCQIQ